ncbi:MAG: hypothetical protein AMXMBFR57_33860 [Acidimicrobiia bacterium]
MRVAIGVAIVIVLGWIGIGVYLRDDAVRHRIVEALSTELDAEVVLDTLEVDVFPTVKIVGTGLRIHRNQDPHSVPPFIVARRFEVVPGLWHVIRGRAQLVQVEGFRFTIPRPPDPTDPTDPTDPKDPKDPTDQKDLVDPILSRVVASDAELVYTPKDLKGPIRAFPVRELELLDVGFNRAMDYHAVVINPQPKGRFESRGSFGPLWPDDPGASPLSGKYTLTDADFNTIKGVAGTVESEGDFTGALAQLHVDGSSTTPNFEIDEGGHPVPLTTNFIATVDCTSGDLHLSEVEGQLAESAFTATGSITGSPGARGRRVELDFSMQDGRAEDVLRLVVPSREPLVVGRMTLDAHFLLPHGGGSAVSRMEVEGRMRVRQAHLGPDAAQAKVDDLSHRAQGKPDDAPTRPAAMNVDGTFSLAESVVRFTELTFTAPGATVSLAGTYGVAGGELDLKGEARMDASLGNLADGIKGFLLTLVSPLFKKDGAGAVVPITVKGTHDEPDVGVDVGRAIKGKHP